MTDGTSQERAERSVAAMYAADAATRALGIVVDGVAPGRARAKMEVAAHMVNGHGGAHGGWIFMLADIAFAYACNTYGETTVGRSCEIEYLAPGREGDTLVAEASERYRRGRGGIYDVTVRREADGQVLAELRGHSRVVAR